VNSHDNTPPIFVATPNTVRTLTALRERDVAALTAPPTAPLAPPTLADFPPGATTFTPADDPPPDDATLYGPPGSEIPWRDLVKMKIADANAHIRGATYVADVPGLSDIFRLGPFTEPTREEKAENIAQMLTRAKDTPAILQRIPELITHIDNTQDMIALAGMVGSLIPAVRGARVGQRAIAATRKASKSLNACTTVLSTSLGGGLSKHAAARTLRKLGVMRSAKLRRQPRPNHWGTFAIIGILGAQVSEQYTGIGLRLGPIMGLITDSNFAWQAALRGEQTYIRLPNNHALDLRAIARACQDTPVLRWTMPGLATRFAGPISHALAGVYRVADDKFNRATAFLHSLLGPIDLPGYHHTADPVSNAIATSLSATVLQSADVQGQVEHWLPKLLDTPYPRPIVTNPITLDALSAHGIPTIGSHAYASPDPAREPTVRELINYQVRSDPQLDTQMLDTITDPERHDLTASYLYDAIDQLLGFAAGPDDNVAYYGDPIAEACLRAIELGFIPHHTENPEHVADFLELAGELATLEHRNAPTADMLTAAARATLHNPTTRPAGHV